MNQVILITGASSGLGKAFALKLIEAGHTVYGAARRIDRMKDIEQAGGHSIAMDMSDDAAMVRAVERIVGEQGRIDVLINNAGYGTYGSVEETPIEEARQQFEVNLFGLGRLTQLVIPNMRKQGRGRIINISSMGGKMYLPLGAWYHASKHALEGWSDCLRLDLKEHGIDVVIIEPGVIRTGFEEVMVAPMIARSGSGPYGALTRQVVKGTEKNYRKGSSPEVVVELVMKAVHARKPRTRYVGGHLAWPVMALRKWGGDRLFDRVIMHAA
ncbi:MAG: SDR family NAD(P)-dependent oxidoreductase [Flavobacteriales bacterium]|nr:SDR family NAD(P)-dependent oxidoreductase [Flavobacteriales bacterium]